LEIGGKQVVTARNKKKGKNKNNNNKQRGKKFVIEISVKEAANKYNWI